MSVRDAWGSSEVLRGVAEHLAPVFADLCSGKSGAILRPHAISCLKWLVTFLLFNLRGQGVFKDVAHVVGGRNALRLGLQRGPKLDPGKPERVLIRVLQHQAASSRSSGNRSFR